MAYGQTAFGVPGFICLEIDHTVLYNKNNIFLVLTNAYMCIEKKKREVMVFLAIPETSHHTDKLQTAAGTPVAFLIFQPRFAGWLT